MKPGNRRKRYYSHYPIHHPSWLVMRRAGDRIETAAVRFFHGDLLDIGCGDKWKRDLVGHLVTRYVGVDHSATRHDPSAIDRLGSAYSLPAADGEFDCVLCSSVLEHLEEPEAALREALRVLKPGGTAIYTAPQAWHLHEEPRDFFRFTRHGLRHLFEKAGFEIVEIEPLSGLFLAFGSELGYYLNGIRWRPLRPLVTLWIVANNLLFLLLEKIKRDPRWTWMNLVVARKPELQPGAPIL